MVELRPLDEGAKPAFDLMYKLPSNLTREVLNAAAPASPAAPAPAQPEILSPTPITPINVNFPLGNVACPPPSYETQRVLAKMVAATVEEKQRLAYSQPTEQYYSPAPQYYPTQQAEKFQQTTVLDTVLKGSNSELTNILVIASVLMAGSPMALVPFVPLLAFLLLPNETPVAPVA